jgi:hypothetical protein
VARGDGVSGYCLHMPFDNNGSQVSYLTALYASGGIKVSVCPFDPVGCGRYFGEGDYEGWSSQCY